jgi:hypothetical protein
MMGVSHYCQLYQVPDLLGLAPAMGTLAISRDREGLHNAHSTEYKGYIRKNHGIESDVMTTHSALNHDVVASKAETSRGEVEVVTAGVVGMALATAFDHLE